MNIQKVVLFSLILAILALPRPAMPAKLPVESFFKSYRYLEPKLCPDGKALAVLAPNGRRIGLAMMDLETREPNWVFRAADANVQWFIWINTNRLLFQLSMDGYGLSSGALRAVDRDGKRMMVLPGGHSLTLVPDSPNDILVSSLADTPYDYQTGLVFPHVSRVNTLTGATQREVTNPGRVFNWVADQNGRVRAAVALGKDRFQLLYRATTNDPWRKLTDWNYDEDGLTPEAFDYNGTLLVASCGDGSTEALYTFDVQKGCLKDLAFRHAEVDLGGLRFSPSRRALVGVSYSAERRETFWFDNQYKRLQTSVDRALPDMWNYLVSESQAGDKMIFLSTNDRTPGAYYLLDATTGKMEKLSELASWIDPAEMAPMRPIQYTARDGLKIHGYLTLPYGAAGTNYPMVVMPHGGPLYRDSLEFEREVQFFANRGYAVLQVNFRGSTGYGKDFLKAGFRQWGHKQQDDITDGVKWAIGQGIADPNRIGIYGVSYGGFAALAGLEQTPELYRWGIVYAGVSDVVKTMAALPEVPIMRLYVALTVGDPKKEKAQLKSISPIENVDQIQVPVLLAYGTLDPRVPIATGRTLARALKKRGKLYDFIEKEDEGHGFHKEENRIELWKKIDAFLGAPDR